MFISSRSSFEIHTRFQTKMDKIYTRSQTKTAQNPTLWGGTSLYGLYKGVPPRALSIHGWLLNEGVIKAIVNFYGVLGLIPKVQNLIGLMVGNVALGPAKTFVWRRVTQDLRNAGPFDKCF